MPKKVLITCRYELVNAKKQHDCDYVISICEASELTTGNPPTPEGIDSKNHFKFYFNDLTEDVYLDLNRQMDAPHENDVHRIIEAWRSLPEDANVLIHCAMGYSRSPAATVIGYCDLLGPGKEVEAFKLAAKACLVPGKFPMMPNIRMIKLADDILGRDGKMVEAFNEYHAAYKQWLATLDYEDLTNSIFF